MVDLFYAKELNLARDLARKAWFAAAELYEGEYDVRQKPDGPVTDADHRVNRVIMQGLREGFPEDGILSEESTDSAERLERERVWVIDPIDGTQDFIKQTGNFAIQIGLTVRTEGTWGPVLGVVYRPISDQMYFGVVGQGAWVTGPQGETSPLRVTTESQMGEMTLVATGNHLTPRFLDLVEILGPRNTINMGSLGLKMIHVATGSADYYLNNARGMCKEWDVCAPEVIVGEAGGVVTCLKHGAKLSYNRPDPVVPDGLLVSNGVCHEGIRGRVLEGERTVRERNGLS